jgi:methanogenic corrinoid protein MtbC1
MEEIIHIAEQLDNEDIRYQIIIGIEQINIEIE